MHLFLVLLAGRIIISLFGRLLEAQAEPVRLFDRLELAEAVRLVDVPVPLMRTKAVVFQDRCHVMRAGVGKRRRILRPGKMKDVRRTRAVGQ
jgi:hypothetical protein